jgi:hypothetical protein
MAIVETYHIGNAIVNMHDDKCVSREKSLQILERVENIIMLSLNAKYQKEKKTNDETAL